MGSDPQMHLTLGWHVSANWEPRYWLKSGARAGYQSFSELVTVPSHSIACHTAIIAQSGSGKSFFLGRLVEEILLRTKSRCIILDPNADFRRVHEVESSDLWRKARYNTHSRKGRLPHESSRNDFQRHWSNIPMRIKSAAFEDDSHYQQLKLNWTSVSVEFLAEDVDPILRSGLYHCHAFTDAISYLVDLRNSLSRGRSLDLFNEAERLIRLSKTLGDLFAGTIEQQFDSTKLCKSRLSVYEDRGMPRDEIERVLARRVQRTIKRAVTAASYVSEDVALFYFGKAREFQATGMLETHTQHVTLVQAQSKRLEVVDLPSLTDPRTRLLAIDSIISSEWTHARRSWSRALRMPLHEDMRAPTFIVIDEAHNLIPANARGKAEEALREQFRTIVAEGRKYGLFLVLVSQRPDKLDPLVLSECDNKAIMRIGSGSVLNITRQSLGLDDVAPKLLEKCLEFDTGRGLLIGRWAPDGPVPFYCAARRTVEGGRNLRESYWAVPADDQITKPALKSKKRHSIRTKKLTSVAKKKPR